MKATDKSIAEVIESDPELSHLFERVTSIKGISQTTAVEVIITTNEFKSITDPKKYACYAGVVPFEHSSGQRKGKARLSQMANKKVNRAAGAVITAFSGLISDTTLLRVEGLLRTKSGRGEEQNACHKQCAQQACASHFRLCSRGSKL